MTYAGRNTWWQYSDSPEGTPSDTASNSPDWDILDANHNIRMLYNTPEQMLTSIEEGTAPTVADLNADGELNIFDVLWSRNHGFWGDDSDVTGSLPDDFAPQGQGGETSAGADGSQASDGSTGDQAGGSGPGGPSDGSSPSGQPDVEAGISTSTLLLGAVAAAALWMVMK